MEKVVTTVRFNQLDSKGNGNWVCSNNNIWKQLRMRAMSFVSERVHACGRIKVEQLDPCVKSPHTYRPANLSAVFMV